MLNFDKIWLVVLTVRDVKNMLQLLWPPHLGRTRLACCNHNIMLCATGLGQITAVSMLIAENSTPPQEVVWPQQTQIKDGVQNSKTIKMDFLKNLNSETY